MKKLLVGMAVVSILAAGTMAFAHGYVGWGGGHMMGPGYGDHMMGWGNQGYGADRKFLDETADLRKDLHDKRFEYVEAQRDPETNTETLTKLEKEIRELQQQIHEKSPRTAIRGYGGYGNCFWQ